MSKPDFDPNLPYDDSSKPGFDPSLPSESVNPASVKQENKPAFDPNLPFQSPEEKYGTPGQMAVTALEQAVSGATLGASKVAETKLLGVKPEDIAGREQTNPVTATASNVAGTVGMIYGTGGLGALGEGATAAGKIGLGALEGAGIGGISAANDDWSQNKSLDAQKIAASAGLGALLGGAGAGIAEGVRAKFSPKIIPPGDIPPEGSLPSSPELNNSPVVDSPEVKGPQAMSLKDIEERVNAAQKDGSAVELPQKEVLSDALSRVPMANPVNPLQLDSLGSQEAREIYKTFKEMPGDVGNNLKNYEAIQKGELVGKAEDAIKNISPGSEPVSDAYKGGQTAIDAFTEQYQNEKSALKPIFDSIKTLPVQGEIYPDAISNMTKAVPNIANMFDLEGGELAVKPYKTIMGIDKATYNAVSQAVDSLEEAPNTFDALWKVRQGLDQNIDVLAQGQGPQEIRSLKAALMKQMQDSSPQENVRESFKRYAINEQQRGVIEKSFGASVGTPEFGQISKVKPEMIGDKIFGNTATVQAAKQILPKDQFNTILANWIAEAKAGATDQGAFSSNKFGSFLKRNQDALNIAFSDSPEKLQELKDLTTIMKILPDSTPINPSGTAKTVMRYFESAHLHNLTYEGMLAAIPQKIVGAIKKEMQISQLNKALQGQATQNTASQTLQNHASKISNQLDRGIKALFSGSASESRKMNNGR